MSGSMLCDPGITLTLQQRVPEPTIQPIDSPAHCGHRQVQGTNGEQSTATSWRSYLGNLSARSYLESCKMITDFVYIDFLKFSESQRLTKNQCETQWSEAIRKLMASGHTGLQKKARSLEKQWKNKAHSDDSDVFWSEVKRKRGLDIGTLEVQAAVDTLWNKRVRKEVEQEINNIADVTSETRATPATDISVGKTSQWCSCCGWIFEPPYAEPRLPTFPSALDKDDENEAAIDDLNIMDVVADEESVGDREGAGMKRLSRRDDESIEDLV
ncbi:hypothetical protein EC957_000510 [Mortierella hygrophila]|uniref:Uncharacterized protein n=1 Tax=Mortierella hygrophila TaxID=979708 RepID=A0A9P6F6P8_9FUNG|nr:hypothetical protein EC957_000510 [Mortierella hygrophila]